MTCQLTHYIGHKCDECGFNGEVDTSRQISHVINDMEGENIIYLTRKLINKMEEYLTKNPNDSEIRKHYIKLKTSFLELKLTRN